MENQIINLDNLRLIHNSNFEGGGIFAKETFIDLLTNGKKYEVIFEWCSGLGTIGFSLLARGICKKLILGEISEKAVEITKQTIQINDLSNSVQVYNIKKLSDLPENLRFDAVVSNPPHFKLRSQVAPTVTKLNHLEIPDFSLHESDGYRMGVDVDWEAHKDFYANIKKYSNADCDIYIWENGHGSNVGDFEEMITAGGLVVKEVIPDTISKFKQCYTIYSKLKK